MTTQDNNNTPYEKFSEKNILDLKNVVLGICTITYIYFVTKDVIVNWNLSLLEIIIYLSRYAIALLPISIFIDEGDVNLVDLCRADKLYLILTALVSLLISIHCDTKSNKYLSTPGIENANVDGMMGFYYLLYFFLHNLGLGLLLALFKSLRGFIKEKRHLLVLFQTIYVFCFGNISNYFFFSYFPHRQFNDILYGLVLFNAFTSFVAVFFSSKYDESSFPVKIAYVISVSVGFYFMSCYLSWRTFPFNLNNKIVLKAGKELLCH